MTQPTGPDPDHDARERVVGAALAELDLDEKTAIVAGADMWALPALPRVGLRAVLMSDGPVGVRGRTWGRGDPSAQLPSPTALAATWDPELARRAGNLLAQEARRKGVHVLLAPTVNLHRSPRGGRHFECYSEDPLLTAEIGTAYVQGVQDGGVAATVKHFVANDSETDRHTVNVVADERTLREIYLAPFEAIVADARPWAVMAAYNGVNGFSMTENAPLLRGVLAEEWGFDGAVVSDWTAARDTVRAALGGTDIAMPGPRTVYGKRLAGAVRSGEVPERVVDEMARRVLRLAARVGALDGAPVMVAPGDWPPLLDEDDVTREVAARSIVCVRNDGTLPIADDVRRVALIGAAAAQPRTGGGGSAQVFPSVLVSPLDGLRAVLGDATELTYTVGADPAVILPPAGAAFTLRAVFRSASGGVLTEVPLPDGTARWLGGLPDGLRMRDIAAVEITGAFTPEAGGAHAFGVRGAGRFTLRVGGEVVFDGPLRPEGTGVLETLIAPPEHRVGVELEAGRPVDVVLRYEPGGERTPLPAVSFTLGHREPLADADTLIAEAVRAAAEADVAVVVVATTEEVESEGVDRASLRLPGRQDELVARVAAANPRTVVVVNAGSPVLMPWRDDVAAALLAWFPGQQGGAAIADVLVGLSEPTGRLPTTWPAEEKDAPVLDVTPTDGELRYSEGVLIGYRGWLGTATPPAYWFGHGLGYTTWAYESVEVLPPEPQHAVHSLGTARVRLSNSGDRAGREVVQVYLSAGAPGGPRRAARWLAGFAGVEAQPGETVEVDVPLPRRAVEVWAEHGWRQVPGPYTVAAGRHAGDTRVTTALVS
ncbi:MAG TPA: glycoside hydrolase family 3 C-terminal domain-containing protein [Streptosporangiaceae bacterium]|jgi:beta-glucosidase